MELRQLRYFLAIAQEKQITAAAKKLNISQPPLSFQLRLLEEELGVRLVERGPRSIRLTEAGELLRRRAEQLLELADASQREVSDCGSEVRGSLSLGTISSSGSVVVGAAMQRFRREYPHVSFEVHEGNTFEMIDMLDKGITQVALVRTPFKTEGLEARYAPEEPMMTVATAENDPGGDKVSLAALDSKPLVYYRRFDSLLTDIFEKNGLRLTAKCRNDDARTTLLWARAGFGIGIVPRSALAIFGDSGLVWREIDCDELRTRLAAIWLRGRYLSAPARSFIACLGFTQ
jgi:DNA-binding transcriptional LysR family regulator